jgi:hypothetical protein
MKLTIDVRRSEAGQIESADITLSEFGEEEHLLVPDPGEGWRFEVDGVEYQGTIDKREVKGPGYKEPDSAAVVWFTVINVGRVGDG